MESIVTTAMRRKIHLITSLSITSSPYTTLLKHDIQIYYTLSFQLYPELDHGGKSSETIGVKFNLGKDDGLGVCL